MLPRRHACGAAAAHVVDGSLRNGGEHVGAVVLVESRDSLPSGGSLLAPRWQRPAAAAGGGDQRAARRRGRRGRRQVVTEHMTDAAGATIGSISLLVDDDTLALIGLRGGAKVRRAAGRRTHRQRRARRRERPHPLAGARTAGGGSHERYPDLELAAEGDRLDPVPASPWRGTGVLGVVSPVLPGHASSSRRRPVPAPARGHLRDHRSPGSRRSGPRRPRGQAGFPGRDQRGARQRPRLRGDADRSRRGRGAVVRRLVRHRARGGRPAPHHRGRAHPPGAGLRGPRAAGALPQPIPSSDQGGYEVLRTGESQLVPEVTDELLVQSAQGRGAPRLMRRSSCAVGCPAR